MTRTIQGHVVKVSRCDGLPRHHRVHADGRFCGLIASDTAGWHTIPATRIGVQAPPVCHAPTCELALSTLITETFAC